MSFIQAVLTKNKIKVLSFVRVHNSCTCRLQLTYMYMYMLYMYVHIDDIKNKVHIEYTYRYKSNLLIIEWNCYQNMSSASKSLYSGECYSLIN